MDLLAGLDIATGRVHTKPHSRHRSAEFKTSLNYLDRETPDGLEVHLTLDNYSTRKTTDIRPWLLRRPRFVLHLTPTGPWWLNLSAGSASSPRRSCVEEPAPLVPRLRQSAGQRHRCLDPRLVRYRRVKSADAFIESKASCCQRPQTQDTRENRVSGPKIFLGHRR